MANALTGGGSGQAWDLLVETAYDRQMGWYLRDQPQWRQLIDKRPGNQAMPGDVVVLSLHNSLGLATTPLTETVDPDAVAAPAPTRVSVTMNEYGNAAMTTLRLRELGFTKPDAEIAKMIAFNMLDSVDAIIRATADGGTNLLYMNGGNPATSGGTLNGVTATDILGRKPSVIGVKLLERQKVLPKDGNRYVAIAHPDVTYDLQAETGATAWIQPHTEGTDTQAVYSGVVGDFMGARYVETTRITTAANSVPVTVYTTYMFGQEALVEVTAEDPHVVIGPQVDKLKRFFPIGWYTLFGHAIYRSQALVQIKTTSSIQGI